MIRLRSFTISEKPTSSNREARLKTVGEVVTVWNRFLPALGAERRIIAWRFQVSLPQAILLRKSFKSGALSVSVDTRNSARVTCSPSHKGWRTRHETFPNFATPDKESQ